MRNTPYRIALLGLGLSLLTGHVLSGQIFFDDFGSYGENTDLLQNGWVFKAPNPANTAVVQSAGTHATVTAFGNGNSRNARLSPTTARFSEVAVSDTENNHLSADIRWTTPGTTGNLTTSYFQAQSSAGAVNMGFLSAGGVQGFFFDLGGGANRIVAEGITFDPEAWYRFSTVFTPSEGLVEFQVTKLGGAEPEIVWLGSNVTEGTASYSATTWAAIEVDVTRPGSAPSLQTSVDFDNIMVASVPEPATTALLLGAVCLGFLGFQRYRTSRNCSR